MFRKSIAVVSSLVALPLSLFIASAAQAGTGTGPALAGAATDCGPGSLPDFKAGHFPDEPKVDNTWLPMKPGTRSEFTGRVWTPTRSPPEPQPCTC